MNLKDFDFFFEGKLIEDDDDDLKKEYIKYLVKKEYYEKLLKQKNIYDNYMKSLTSYNKAKDIAQDLIGYFCDIKNKSVKKYCEENEINFDKDFK